MPRLQARRTRRELTLRPEVRLSAEQVRELVLAETEDEEKADAAMCAYVAAQMKAGETPS
jgi:predicted RNase H-like nuclease